MATLKEILDNAQFADNLEFNDEKIGKVSLGELRNLRKMAEGEQQTAATKRAEAERLAAQAATLLASLQEQAEKGTKQQAAAPGDDWRKDPFYQPIVPELEKYNQVIEKLNKTVEAQQKALDNAQAIYALERMRGQYNALPESVRKANKFEELAKQAVSAGAKDSYGLPTLDPIVERLTEPDRIEAAKKEAVEAARKEWQQEQAVSATTKPGSQARFRNQKSEKPPISKIEELTSEVVMQDPDVRAAWEGTTVQ
jgi:hypothetical protein